MITLVAWREIRERLRSKAFLASTVLILALVGGSAVPGRLYSPEETYRVAVTAPAPPSLAGALRRAAAPFDDATVQVRIVASASAGRELLESEDVDALLLLSDDRLVFRSDVDAKVAAVADAAVRQLRRRLPPEPELTTATLRPPEQESSDAEVLVATVGSVLLLTSLAFYGQWVVSGVVEEKSNRVVELVLSSVRPRHLLAGKVIGIGLLGLAQLTLVAGLATGLLVAGVFDAPADLGGDVALVIPWFALGYALDAVAYAAAGALASSQQNADTAGQPVTYTCSRCTSSGTSLWPMLPRAFSRTRSRSSRPAPRSSSPPAPPWSACRSGSTCSRCYSCSPRSSCSSGSPGASTPTGSFAAGRASASVRHGASRTDTDASATGVRVSRRSDSA